MSAGLPSSGSLADFIGRPEISQPTPPHGRLIHSRDLLRFMADLTCNLTRNDGELHMASSAGAPLTVADILVDYLVDAGVTEVFGVAGSTIMPILDSIATDGRIKYVGARYEQSAADMASGYARASGRLGVVLTHVGPGATSVFTAMVGAACDGVPLLLITGNEESDTLSRKPYHDWDILGVMSTVTNSSQRLSRAADLPHMVRRALGKATRVVTQPVHLDIPEDIALERISSDEVQEWSSHVAPTLSALRTAVTAPISRPAPSESDIRTTVDLVIAANKPVLIVGESPRHLPGSTVTGICNELGMPYATTHGRRAGGEGDPRYVGTIGRFGSDAATEFVNDADLVISLGAELTDVDTKRWRIPTADSTKIIVHPDGDRVDLRYAPEVGVVADVEQFLLAVQLELAERECAVDPDWLDRAGSLSSDANSPSDEVGVDDDHELPLDALLVKSAIESIPDTWAIAIDPGFGSLTLTGAARPRSCKFLYPYGFGYMGFAVPNAIGAVQSGAVDGALVVIGDGAFFMSLSSLESISSLNSRVVVIVLDDGGFGSQRKKQSEGYGGRIVGVDYENPDIAQIGAALGLEAKWMRSSDDVSAFCQSLSVRTDGALVVVSRSREQQGSWYEGTVRPE